MIDTCVHRVDWWFVLQVRETLWNPTPEVKARRLCRYTVPIDAQENYESEKWVLEVYILFWNSTTARKLTSLSEDFWQ